MPILLVHKTLDGEPVGIWSDDNASYYIPGNEEKQVLARIRIEDRAPTVPWSEYVKQVADSMNFRDLWEYVDRAMTREEALDDVRRTFFTQQGAEVLEDR